MLVRPGSKGRSGDRSAYGAEQRGLEAGWGGGIYFVQKATWEALWGRGRWPRSWGAPQILSLTPSGPFHPQKE